MKPLNSRGDTVVEVLIAILIISTILAGAFVSSRQSQNIVRQSQERSEALQVAEGQLERVKALAQTPGSGVYDDEGSPFCIKPGDNTKLMLTDVSLTLSADDFSQYNSSCISKPNGGVTYYSSVRRDDKNTFVVRTRWDGVGGIGKQETLLALRISP